MKAKEIAIWLSIIAVLIGGFWLLINAVNSSPSPSNPVEIKNLPAVSKDDFVRGNFNAKATLVEYADFQCSACGIVYPLVKRLEGDFPNDLRVVYRFFPLISTHKNALLSSKAGYAAGLQGKFWEMHDMLYENQGSWSNIDPYDTFLEYAKKIGLNLDKFKTDLESESARKFVIDAEDSAIATGINSTPTFIINGTLIGNPADYEALKAIIQNEINKK